MAKGPRREGSDVTRRGNRGREASTSLGTETTERNGVTKDRARHILSLLSIIKCSFLPRSRCGSILTHALSSSRCSFVPIILFARSLFSIAVLYLPSYSCSLTFSRCSPVPTILFALSFLPLLYSHPRCIFFSILINRYY